jgi:hypothetical protein
VPQFTQNADSAAFAVPQDGQVISSG